MINVREMTKVALITGASRGIGRATALMLAEQGYAIGINYLSDKTAAESLLKEVRSRATKAVLLQADVASEEQVVAMFEQLDRELGTPNVLVNNAGILRQQASLLELDQARMNDIIQVNLIGSMLCAREVVKRMSTKHGGVGGAIVNVSSIAAKTGSPNEYLDYAASKGAIDSFTRGLASEVADQGIRVNAVRPGFIETQMHADGGEPERVARLASSIPMQRGGKADEVAAAICFLLSDQAAYISGTFLDVAGGR